jgi:hypothetical protein
MLVVLFASYGFFVLLLDFELLQVELLNVLNDLHSEDLIMHFVSNVIYVLLQIHLWVFVSTGHKFSKRAHCSRLIVTSVLQASINMQLYLAFLEPFTLLAILRIQIPIDEQ